MDFDCWTLYRRYFPRRVSIIFKLDLKAVLPVCHRSGGYQVIYGTTTLYDCHTANLTTNTIINVKALYRHPTFSMNFITGIATNDIGILEVWGRVLLTPPLLTTPSIAWKRYSIRLQRATNCINARGRGTRRRIGGNTYRLGCVGGSPSP